MRQRFIKVIAILFIIAAIVIVITGVMGYIPCPINYIGIASILGTLAGAILVFSTLEMQLKSLNEEKRSNETERFNSRFYPILSSFRTDASNMEIVGDCLSSNGIRTTLSNKGERAFIAAKSMIIGINRYFCDKSNNEFDKEVFEAELRNYSDILDAQYEDNSCLEDIKKTENDQKKYIKSNQILYLADKWGITKDDKIKYLQMERKDRESFLLDILIDHQSATFSKYIQSLRFILQIIGAIEIEAERKDYYQHVLCLLGKEELKFLKCFSEFDKITDKSYGQR